MKPDRRYREITSSIWIERESDDKIEVSTRWIFNTREYINYKGNRYAFLLSIYLFL